MDWLTHSEFYVMRVLVESYGDIRIFYERPYGYKRYIIEWDNGTTSMLSGLWYKEQQVRELVEKVIQDRDI